VYPNPADDHVQVELKLDAPATYTIEMVNLLGQKVGKAEVLELGPGTHLIAVRTYLLASGMYQVRILDASGKLVQAEKIIVR
jgi:hypothetical protein